MKSIIPPTAKRPRGKTSVCANPRLVASASSAEPGAALARGVKASSPRVARGEQEHPEQPEEREDDLPRERLAVGDEVPPPRCGARPRRGPPTEGSPRSSRRPSSHTRAMTVWTSRRALGVRVKASTRTPTIAAPSTMRTGTSGAQAMTGRRMVTRRPPRERPRATAVVMASATGSRSTPIAMPGTNPSTNHGNDEGTGNELLAPRQVGGLLKALAHGAGEDLLVREQDVERGEHHARRSRRSRRRSPPGTRPRAP